MAQFEFPTINAAVNTGTDLSDWLNQWVPAVVSNHLGAGRPSYALAGCIWVDNTSLPTLDIYFFDGTNDVLLYSIDSNTGTIIAGGGGSGGSNFQGVIDATTAVPSAPSAGDFYVNDTAGTVASGWGAPAAGQTIGAGDTLVFDTSWHVIPSPVDLSGYLPLTGGTLTGSLILNGPPLLPNEAATKDYVDQNGGGNSLPLGGGTLTGFLTLNADPTAPLHAATKNYVDVNDALKVNKAGDTMTGFLTLAGAPTATLHAANKGYVDNWHDATKVNKGGDTMTGPLVLPGNASAALQAVPKQQLDAATISTQTSIGAPDGNKLVKTLPTGKIDASLISISGTPSFKGIKDPTTTAPAHGAGHYYIIDPTGIYDASWGAPLAGTTGIAGDIVISDGNTWSATSGAGTTSYVNRDGQQFLGADFELIATNTAAKTLIDGVDATLSSIKNVSIAGGVFGTPESLISHIYSDVTTETPTAAEIPGGGLGLNRADRQLFGLNASNIVGKLLAVTMFSAAASYAAGAHVMESDTLYIAKAPVSPGTFNAAQWNEFSPNLLVNGTSDISIPTADSDILVHHNGTLVAEFTDAYPDAIAYFHGGVIVDGNFSSSGTVFADVGNFQTTLIAQGYDVLTTNTGYTQAQVDALIAGTGSPNIIVNGTSSVDIPIADGAIDFTVGGTQKAVIDATGLLVSDDVFADFDLYVGGTISTGGETAPDVDAGGICLNHGGGDGNAFEIKNSDVAIPFTGILDSNTYATFSKVSVTGGGLSIRGATETDRAISLIGYATTANTLTTDVAVLNFYPLKSDGGTSVVALGSSDNGVAIYGNLGTSTPVAVFKGNGDLYSTGDFNGVQGIFSSNVSAATGFYATNASIALRGERSTVDHGMTAIVPTDTYLNINIRNDGIGGVHMQGISEAEEAVLITGRATGATTGNTGYGCVALLASKKNGTTAQALAATENAISFHNQTNIPIARITGNGDVYSEAQFSGKKTTALTAVGAGGFNLEVTNGAGNRGGFAIYNSAGGSVAGITGEIVTAGAYPTAKGKLDIWVQNATVTKIAASFFDTGAISTGGAVPDAEDGGITILAASGGRAISIKDSAVAHGVTGYDETDTYGRFGQWNPSSGGLQVRGYTELDTNAVAIFGISTTEPSGDTDAIVTIHSRVKSGTIAVSPSSNANIFAVKTAQATPRLRLTSVGDLFLKGQVTSKINQSYSSTTTRTSVAADECSMVDINNAGAITYTIDNNAHEVNAIINIMQTGVGQITIAGSNGAVILKPASFNAKTREQYSTISAWKRNTTDWVLFGNLEAA